MSSCCSSERHPFGIRRKIHERTTTCGNAARSLFGKRQANMHRSALCSPGSVVALLIVCCLAGALLVSADTDSLQRRHHRNRVHHHGHRHARQSSGKQNGVEMICVLLHGTGSQGFKDNVQKTYEFTTPDEYKKATSKQPLTEFWSYWGEVGMRLLQRPAGGEVLGPKKPKTSLLELDSEELKHHKQSAELRAYGCDKLVLHYTNTNDFSWDDEPLIKEYCDVVRKQVAPGQKRMVAVFTHSMGNLVIAAGIATETCSDLFVPSDRKPTKEDLGKAVWFGIDGPNSGTPAALYCKQLCQVKAEVIKTALPTMLQTIWTDMKLANKAFQDAVAAIAGCDCGTYVAAQERIGDRETPTTKLATLRCSTDYLSKRSWKLKNGTNVLVQISAGPHVRSAYMKETRDPNTKILTTGWAAPLRVLRDYATQYMWGNQCGTAGSTFNTNELLKDRFTIGPDRGPLGALILHVVNEHIASMTLDDGRGDNVIGKGWMVVPDSKVAVYGLPKAALPDLTKTNGKDDNVPFGGVPETEAPHGADGLVPFWSCSGAKRPEFKTSFDAPYYAMTAGHMDGTGLFPDSDRNPALMPQAWFLLRVEQARAIAVGLN